MTVTPTYPGVYIEELPSATHAIIGVATSITAFVGYTKRGPVNQAIEVQSFGDFERKFGSLDPDCSLTYAVQQFFLNGGSDAFIVRVAAGALPASITLRNGVVAGAGVVDVLDLTAASAGLWGNTLEVTIDQNTVNPASLFNLTVTEYVASGGSLVPGNSESFRNLTMTSTAAAYAVDTINNNSQLLTAARGAGLPVAPTVLPGVPNQGTSTSAPLPTTGIVVSGTANIVVSVDGGPPTELTIPPGAYTRATLATEIVNEATNAGMPLSQTIPTGAGTMKPIIFSDPTNPVTERSAVHFTPAPSNDWTVKLGLGIAGGGIEADAISAYHPVPTGTTGGDLDTALGGDVTTLNGVARAVTATVTLPAGSAAVNVPLMTNTTALGSKEDLRVRLQSALQAASLTDPTVAPALGGAGVQIINNKLVVTAGGRPDTQIALTNAGADTTATSIGFAAGPPPNVAAYSPSIAAPLLGQLGGGPGADGTAPAASDIQGDQDHKTGIYALENVDLFNLLVLPDDFSNPDDSLAIMAEAISYCEQRRAMLIVDLPVSIMSLTAAQTWIKNPGTPKSANAAAYFPRALFPDPLQANRPRPMPTAGAIAGLYARTDASRGVWKAPAGTEANVLGPQSLLVPLTDMENGTINPLGLNAIRALPIYGIVSWGARTLMGADVMASQWKYVPVRRTALYIEESLYRGTKWVVFEPNDYRLWAAIRLNVTAFMQTLFRQGFFAGDSPAKAYLVKCDSETTTSADVDAGIVNILVGFAPLEPAEFVIIQITQLAQQDS